MNDTKTPSNGDMTTAGISPFGAARDRANRRQVQRLRRNRYREQVGQNPSAGAAAPTAHKRTDTEEASALQKARAELAQLKDQYLRARSDLDNYRKRVAREREEQRKFANEAIIKALLETVDNLERAIQGAEKTHDIQALHSGVQMIHQQFLNALQRQGVEIIEANPGAKFNPAYHEAVLVEPHPEYEDDSIIECLQTGYLLNDRVLRAAMVKVAKNG